MVATYERPPLLVRRFNGGARRYQRLTVTHSLTLKELFSNIDARYILDFTKESGFYRAI